MFCCKIIIFVVFDQKKLQNTMHLSRKNKLKIIEQLILLNDDDVFVQVEELISKASKRPDFTPFTSEEPEKRIAAAMDDIANNRTYTLEEVEAITKNW